MFFNTNFISLFLVVINPGNPTGSVLTKENIVQIIRFARANNLLIIADEVYQHNIWKQGASFVSFKKVMHELGIQLELASFMSASKGEIVCDLLALIIDFFTIRLHGRMWTSWRIYGAGKL